MASQAVAVESLESRTLFSVPALGINIRRLGLGAGDQLFADAMKSVGPWSTNLAAPNANQLAPIDANGWPTSDAAVEVIQGTISDTADYGGTYALSFPGQATVSPVASQPFVHVTNLSYDSASNTTTGQVIVDPGSHDVMLDFTNTRRLPTDTSATGVHNIHLMRPNGVDSSTPYPSSTLFSTPILNLVSKFSAIRFMDYSLANYNPSVNWSDRTVPAAEQANNGKGGAWEYAVALGNATHEGIWLNIPEMATNAYITDLAQLIKYGSDGVNPYTGPIGSAVTASNPNPVPAGGPAYAGLDANLPVYLEYSNEVWNTVFSQSQQNSAAAVAEVNAGGSPLNYDGDTNQTDWSVRRQAMRTVITSEIFRGVFGDSAMGTQIRPLYEWQYSNLNNTAAIGLNFINNYYNNGDGLQHVANPHPVNYYLWGGGGAWYGTLSNVNGTGDVTIPGANFASPAVSGFQADPSGSTWAFSSTSGIAANGSALGNPAATSGTQAAYLQGTGSFSETVNFTGGLADLAFGAATTGSESFTVSIDGNNASSPWTLTSAYSTQRTAVFDTGVSAGPHTVTFTGTGGSGNLFISNVVAETANGMYKSTVTDITNTTKGESIWANAYGLQMAGYEGGFTFGSGFTGTPLQIAANLDPRAEAADFGEMEEFYAAGGNLAMYLDTTDYIAALTLDINNQNTSKIRAVDDVLATPQPALKFGTVLPSTAGQSVTAGNFVGPNQGAAALYPINVPTPGTYHLTLTGMQSGTEAEQFLLDGQTIPGLTFLPTGASGNSSPALTFTITTPGQHTLMLLLRGSGTISPSNPGGQLTITAGPGPALPAVPVAPTNPGTAVASSTQVNLSWTASAGVVGYQIQRSPDGVNFKIIGATTNASSYNDTTAVANATYTYRIVPYNSGGYGSATTFAPVTVVVVSTVKHLVFTTPPPASSTAGTSIGSASGGVKVSVENANNAIVTADASTVTLTLHGGTFASGGTTATAIAVNGVATFSSLVIDKAAAGYSLTATDGSVTSANSSTFAIVPGAVSVSKSSITVSSATVALGATSTVTLQTRDAWGNNLTAGGLAVVFKLAGTGTSSGTFSAVTDHGNGTYTATFTATSYGTARQISATIGSVAVTSALPAITVPSTPITAAAVTFKATQGRSTAGTVATFTVPNLSALMADFTATIIWGDTQTSVAGTIVHDSAGKFHVTGTHTYSKLSPSGGFPIKVTIKEAGGLTVTVSSAGVVTAAPLVALTLAAITTPVNTSWTNKVIASFQDDNPLQTLAGAYAGTINWGDGTASTTAAFQFSSTKAGVASTWNVLGTHKYTKKGTFTLTATIHEVAATSVTVTLKTVVHVV